MKDVLITMAERDGYLTVVVSVKTGDATYWRTPGRYRGLTVPEAKDVIAEELAKAWAPELKLF